MSRSPKRPNHNSLSILQKQNENIAITFMRPPNVPRRKGVVRTTVPRGYSTDYGAFSHNATQRDSRRTPARRSELRASSELGSCSAIRRLPLRRSGGPTASSGGPASGSIPPASLLIGHLAPGVETVELLGRGWDVARGCELCERGHWEGHAPPPQGGRYPGVRGGGRRSRRAVAARLTLTLSLT